MPRQSDPRFAVAAGDEADFAFTAPAPRSLPCRMLHRRGHGHGDIRPRNEERA
ncbi:hypothetical protein [Cupriavidus sp. 2KB_15]|uniref:hypothetical protein n=1 Tax=Cupriavidus sp. 2KB_15 TaxID=3232976 RepID=UPI003F930EA2